MTDGPQGLHRRAACGCHGYRRMEEEAPVGEAEHRHRGAEPHAQEAHRRRAGPEALGERCQRLTLGFGRHLADRNVEVEDVFAGPQPRVQGDGGLIA